MENFQIAFDDPNQKKETERLLLKTVSEVLRRKESKEGEHGHGTYNNAVSAGKEET